MGNFFTSLFSSSKPAEATEDLEPANLDRKTRNLLAKG